MGSFVRISATARIYIPMLAPKMDRISHDRLGAFEPIRIFFQGCCPAISPWLRFVLRDHVYPLTPYIITARPFGIRCLLTGGYALSGLVLLLTAAAAFWSPAVAPILLLATALMISSVEGAGNVPFLRAMRPHERAAIAGIYMTYRDISQFVRLALLTLILAVSQLVRLSPFWQAFYSGPHTYPDRPTFARRFPCRL